MNIVKNFGTTLLFLFFVLLFIQGARMAIKIALPTITKVTPSLGAALSSVA